ncbi:MAG: Asp-tRNA(Asn)/Glu-tRNA(Gln) amidotransferase subunit GatA [Acidimicrobiia bacterium]|nr:Asp-tRNA(Asn)/Glu-tRNA(Gln) amidotransferase subunit GatA [Acidimicrobiia bacterium]
MNLAELDIVTAAEGLRKGDHTAVDLLEASLARANHTEAELHCYLHIDHDGARAAAEEADRELAAGNDRGPLHGIPLAVKDNMNIDGLETTCASQILTGWVAPYDAHVVGLLKEAGAVLTGKTNLDEFAMGSSTENSAFGPTRNPWDTDKVPGGSSGGSAASVSVGSSFGAFGSDTGGSIRQPAALCGVVGLKPTYGTVSRRGLVAFASSLDQIGPLARTVEDARILLEATWGHDPGDATSWRGDFPDISSPTVALDGLRIGVISQLSGEAFEPGVTDAVSAMINRLSDEGASLEEISIPAIDAALPAYYLVAPSEASGNLARFDGVRYGLREDGATSERMMSATRASGFGPEVIRRILLGTFALSAGYHDAFYGQAQRVRTHLANEMTRVYQDFDVLVSPTTPTTAFGIGSKTDDPLAMYFSDVATAPSNLTGHPAVSVPIAVDDAGLPVGFQIHAPAFGEARMLAVAAEVERLADFDARPALAGSPV